MKLDVWHNLLWSKYKAGVFSSLQVLAHEAGIDLHVFQIAETASDRVALSSVDRSVHKYDYTLLFEGSLDAVPLWRLAFVLGSRTLKSDADFTILAGY